jgi:signal peptidase II
MPLSVMARLAAAIVAIGLLLFIDMRSKSWAASDLRARGPRTVAGGQVRLVYRENKGIAFGRLRDGTRQSAIVAYSTVMALALAGVLVHRLVRRRPAGWLIPAGCAGLLAGTMGNLHDRLERGYVIDFIDLSAGQRVSWPTFNVADIFLGTGIVLCLAGLVAALVRHRRPAVAA